MNYEGYSLVDLIDAKTDPQTGINTENIAANATAIVANKRVLAFCSTNPSSAGDVSQSVCLLENGPRILLGTGLGVNSAPGLLSSSYSTDESIGFGLGTSGTPQDVRYLPAGRTQPVFFRVNLQMNVELPAAVVIYTANLYIFVTLYSGGVAQLGRYYLDNRSLAVPPGGLVTTFSFNNFVFSSGDITSVDEIRIRPEIDCSVPTLPLTPYVKIVQNSARPLGNYFEVEVL
jgi:hypothetical protein